MSRVIILFGLLCLVGAPFVCANDRVLRARQNLIHDTTVSEVYYVAQGEVARVPRFVDISEEAARPYFSAEYTTTVTFERGCSGVYTPEVHGVTHYPDLVCEYSRGAFLGCSSNGTVDPVFTEESEVYLVSSVKLEVELSCGHRVRVSILTDAIVEEIETCDPVTSREQILIDFAQALLQRNYEATAPLLAPDIVVEVNVAGTQYIGIPAAIAYFLLGDPAISDVFETIASELLSLASNGNLAFAELYQTIKSLQLPVGPDPQDPLNVYNDKQIFKMGFNEYNKINLLRITVDTAKVAAYYPQATNPNITEVCDTIQTHCQGPLQQFPDEAACQSFMSGIPLVEGPLILSVGSNTVGCRHFHTTLAIAYPEGHCFHTGPYWEGDLVATPCNDATSAWNPLPGSKRSVAPRGTEQLMACSSDADMCKWGIAGHDKDVTPLSVLMEQAWIANIPAAGQIIDQYVASQA